MTIFNVLTLVGGLCLFLFGMDIMGQALERSAGGSLRSILGRLTKNKFAGLLTGLCVTAVIQSSSATTVMVVGFVNSALMTLRQAIGVIMGANIGTTVTAWILSLGGIESDNIILSLLKPSSFTPILALIGIVFYMFTKRSKNKDIGVILLGFATLMFGMETMSGAVKVLKDVPAFAELFVMFKNPILGVLAGAILTAIIQSSSASVGILQALAVTGRVSYGAAIPIIMGQNIGTCITALISSVGANRNAKRAALVHLTFNILGTVICLAIYSIVKAVFNVPLFDESASLPGIAITHSIFNVACTVILFPMSGLLEKIAMKLIPDAKTAEKKVEIDERLLATPAIALEQCHGIAIDMFDCAAAALRGGLASFTAYTDELAADVCEYEEKTDHYEDVIGTFLVKLSSHDLSKKDSAEAAKLLKLIGDFERISDHGVNLLKSAEELREKKILLTDSALAELKVIFAATGEIIDTTRRAFVDNDIEMAHSVEPIEQVIDNLKETLRARHIARLQQGECSIEAGFVWSDILTNIGRCSDHCSNIAGCVADMAKSSFNLHESIRDFRENDDMFKEKYGEYSRKYQLN